MAEPEEFKIHIEPDGRVIFEGVDMRETSWRRIMELLEDTVGPVVEMNRQPGEPPRIYLASSEKKRPMRREE